MSNQFLAKVGWALMVSLGALVPLEAKALPFEATPEGFAEYFNNVPWNSSSKFRFFNPHKCDLEKATEYSSLTCYVDYEETSSLGTRTCLSRELVYDDRNNTWQLKTEGYSTSGGIGYGAWTYTYTPGECGPWKQVSAAPEPTPEQNSQPEPTTSNDIIKLTKTHILAGGASFFLLGGAIGAIAATLNRRKKD